MMNDLLGSDKKHRTKKSGVKADKKKLNEKKKKGLSTERHNPKAFGVANIVRTKKTQQRNLDRLQKKEIVPLTDRSEDVTPPSLVVVMGPPGCGKSTLIRSLVKIYSGQNLTDTKGPITVVAGKKKRLTFFECPSDDLHAMADLAKTADLVLLLVDASYGFEMETFEFLNLLQLHGFPKVMGVLTHLDSFRQSKLLHNTRKALKTRFWTEIYKGAKMFEFNSVINNKYPKHEVKRLSLQISRIKFRPLVWRNTHPYVMVDRIEDVTASSQSNGDTRDVTLYGFVRGTHLKPSMRVHLIGAGDFDMSHVSVLPDPCPLPQTSGGGLRGDEGNGAGVRKSLRSKDSLLYAPMANVGRVTMDRDGVYIELKDVHYTKKDQLQLGSGMDKKFTRRGRDVDGASDEEEEDDNSEEDVGDMRYHDAQEGTPAGLLKSMQEVNYGVDKKMEHAEMSLFAGSKAVKSSEVAMELEEEDDGYDSDEQFDEDVESGDEEEDEDDQSDDEDVESGDEEEEEESDYGSGYDEEEDEEAMDGEYASSSSALNSAISSSSGAEWKSNMKSKATDSFLRRSVENIEQGSGLTDTSDLRRVDWMTVVYGKNWQSNSQHSVKVSSSMNLSDSDDSDGEELFKVKSTSVKKTYDSNNALDSNRYHSAPGTLQRWKEALEQSKAARQYEKDLADRTDDESDDQPDDESDESDDEEDSDEENSDDDEIIDKEEYDFSYMDEMDPPPAAGVLKPPLFLALKNKFVTGNWEGKGINASLGNEETGNDDEEYGDFEDLQTGEVFTAGGSKKQQESDSDGEDDSSEDDEARNDDIDEQLRRSNAMKKGAAKSKFDDEYDQENAAGGSKGKKKMSEEEVEDEKFLEMVKKKQEDQREKNKSEFGEDGETSRLQHEGLRQGLYVRIVIRDVPAAFTDGFSAQSPLILGGLLPHETAMGLIQARVKRHRWHRRILKSNDPLIFSVGWRRYQSIPIYSLEDINERQRYLKYTPEHMHCLCTFYGPMVPPNTGVLAYQKCDRNTSGFRISLTGTALELQSSSAVVKKLKLVGTPTKIFKNTAFVTGMFNSALEVAKYEGAKLKTVSGIRGQVKKSFHEGDAGAFRATFEDKILMSDLIICRMWVPVELKRFYNPVTSLLSSGWTAMRTTAQVRQQEQVAIPVNKDSLYKPIERTARTFSKTVIPKKLQEALPFKSKPKQQKASGTGRTTYMQRRAVVLEPEDKDKRAAIQMLSAIKNDKVAKRVTKNRERIADHHKALAKSQEKFAGVDRDEKKRKYTERGKEEVRRAKKAAKNATV